jgi:hypothetical protein
MRNKLAFWFITIILLAVLLYSWACLVVMPVMTHDHIPTSTTIIQGSNEKQITKPNKKNKVEDKDVRENQIPESLKVSNRKEAISKLVELRMKENFLQSKMSLINDDSMYFVVDLVKKTADLELKGVSLHECEILDSQISNFITHQPAESLLSWSREPFHMLREDATIPKVSWIVKIAPKDTIEANQAEELPEPPKRGDVYVVMDFDRNLRLIIQQAEKPDKEGDKIISELKGKYRKQEVMKSLDALLHFKRETVKPTIDIVLSKADATILYRALPYKPKLLIRLN